MTNQLAEIRYILLTETLRIIFRFEIKKRMAQFKTVNKSKNCIDYFFSKSCEMTSNCVRKEYFQKTRHNFES